MNVSLKPFDFARATALAGLGTDGQPLKATPATPTEQGSFQTAMADAVKAVSDAQLETSALQRELQLGNPTVSIEQTMVAMNKTQIGFQAVLSVRNRLVQAYSDIMNVQV